MTGSSLQLEPSANDEGSTQSPPPKKLKILELSVLVFYSVSGGPFGMEAAVRAGGPFYTLLGLLIMPLIWSLPEAAVTAELGSAYPEASGGVAWVEEAFGTQAGWLMGWLSWISGVTDTTIYPVLFLDYLLQVVHMGDLDPLLRWTLVSILAVILTSINYLGLKIVGDLSLVICLLSMSPFVLACILGVSQVDPRRWFTLPSPDSAEDDSPGIIPSLTLGGVLLRPFLNNLFWNLNSFDSGACFSAEVDNPGRTFPRAMFWSVLFVFLGYFVPLFVLLGASDAPQSAWVDGYLATSISNLFGSWLGDWTVFAAGVSNIALFQAEISSDAYQLMGMSDRGYLPGVFGARSRFGTPTYGLLLGLIVVLVMSVTDLSTLIEMLNFNYAISLLMEYAAFLKLRISKPDIQRPYRIPLNTVGCFLALTPTLVMTLLVMALASLSTIGFSALSLAVGYSIFVVYKGRRGQVSGYARVDTELQYS